MLRISVEFVPYGLETEAREIGNINIFNRGDHEEGRDFTNFTYHVIDGKHVVADGQIENHPNAEGWISLIKKVMERVDA